MSQVCCAAHVRHILTTLELHHACAIRIDTCWKHLKGSTQNDLLHNLGRQHSYNFPPEILMLLGGVSGSVSHGK